MAYQTLDGITAYVQKPLAHNIREVRKRIEFAQKKNLEQSQGHLGPIE